MIMIFSTQFFKKNCLLKLAGLLLFLQFDAFAQSQTFTATDDAMIYQASQSNNYGTNQSLLVKIQNGQTRYSYIKFNLSSFNLNATGKAIIKLYCSAKETANNTINLLPVDNGWQESTLSWSNAPSRTGAPIVGSNTITEAGKYYEWDITSYIQSLNVSSSSNTIVSFVVSDGNTSNSTITFRSKEAASGATPPQLVISQNADVANTYYIDADNGSDNNDGLSTTTAWQSLTKVNAVNLVAGSKLLFKAGSSWIGQLAPSGSGVAGNPIIIDQYGTGPKPIIHGNGLVGTGTIKLYNQSFWEINNLEITNTSATPQERRGVEINGANFGLMEHIYLNNLVIHDVNGTVGNALSDKKSAAIYFTVTDDSTVPTRYHDIKVENCLIYNIENQGIVTSNEVTVSDYPGSVDWEKRKITNLLVRNNTIYNISKNAMIIRLADGGLVERNLCHDTSYGIDPSTGENIGGNIMFSRSARNTIFQYNEGYNNKGTKLDGSMYDPDISSPGTIWQYSFSHDNQDGLFLSCTNAIDTGIICRYNISQNDKNALIFLNFDVSEIRIYNNTFYIGEGLRPRIIQENTTRDHTYTFYNNIVYNHPNNSNNPSNGSSGVRFAFAPSGSAGIQNRTIVDNIFYNTPQPSQINFTTNLTSNPMFVAPGTATTGLNSVGGYKLKPGSPALNAGRIIPNNGGKDYFGITVSATVKPNIGFYNGPGTNVAAIDENFHIYLLTGQSNMSGRGTVASNVDVSNPRIKVLKQDGTWATATHPLHGEIEPTAAGVGPGLAFALKMLENSDPNVTIGLVPTAVGGQSITAFEPGVTNDRTNKSIYNESIKYVNIARTQGVLKGILFHQGEANNNTATSWLTRVKALISNFRTEFNNPQLPFIIGEMGRFPAEPNKYDNILAVMPGLVAEVPFTALVSSTGLTDINDGTHFNSSSATALGIRYAEKMKEVITTLPVELLDFTATKKTNGALLQWRTASESNNAYFNIERSTDGKTFIVLGKINGAGNSSVAKSYSFTDRNPDKGANYYRLTQFDNDGKNSSSKIIALTYNVSSVGDDLEVVLYPNPAKEKIYINIKGNHQEQVKIEIFDLTGKKVSSLNFKPSNEIQQDINRLNSGVYVLRVSSVVGNKLMGSARFIKH
ncbi:MAG: sialate O-acetylesterase [Pedobacter sp.]|uniref:sialate O-acetylesterase n=1 Tax=Pedobacter sp. TaxID=1411316 RepID=UPI0028087110|nr:sialate O-acetylesterase [Pedobacter sp.]MDQ8005879.1 sialate O-acetylesterase [Pedobacter sp.]